MLEYTGTRHLGCRAEVTHMRLKPNCLMRQEEQLGYSITRALLALGQPDEWLSTGTVKGEFCNLYGEMNGGNI